MKNNLKLISFIISLLYVFVATIVVMVSFSKYEIMGFDHNHPLWIFFAIVTIPANFLLWVLVMVDNSFLSIAILQTIIFLIFWFCLYNAIKMNQSNRTDY